MRVEIDPGSGFCFGVVFAIRKAEEELVKYGSLYCLGDIVHNNVEVDRLAAKGLITTTHDEFKNLQNCRVLIRAHGEPPETYTIARQNNITLIDATCPVVLKLQHKIRVGSEDIKRKNGQVVIYGKEGHAEVNGLVGQTNNEAIVVNSFSDLDKIDFTKPVILYSQTTQSPEGFQNLVLEIKNRMALASPHTKIEMEAHNTICNQVSSRTADLSAFSLLYDVVIFVSGKKSSNGKILFDVCKQANQNTYFVSETTELNPEWFRKKDSVGICGATSTPRWLMEKIAEEIKKL